MTDTESWLDRRYRDRSDAYHPPLTPTKELDPCLSKKPEKENPTSPVPSPNEKQEGEPEAL